MSAPGGRPRTRRYQRVGSHRATSRGTRKRESSSRRCISVNHPNAWVLGVASWANADRRSRTFRSQDRKRQGLRGEYSWEPSRRPRGQAIRKYLWRLSTEGTELEFFLAGKD